MNRLEGANCAGLPGFVIDKYFDCDVGKEPFKARTALAICAHCAVIEACREQAMLMPRLPQRGVLGGETVRTLRRARSWRNYETGALDNVPEGPRPEWLPRADAAETVEQARLEANADEPPIER